MTIKKIIYVNLERRSDRNACYLKEMEAAGVPLDLIERFPAKDWKDYDSVEHTIVQMQKEDGFGQWVLDGAYKEPNDFVEKENRGLAAYIWSFCKVWKRIIDDAAIGDRDYVLVMHDDASLKCWDSLNRALQTISFRPQLMQLFYIHCDPIPRNLVGYHNAIWNTGIMTFGEHALIVDKGSSSRMLALMQGCHRRLLPVETALLEHYNNHRSVVHPAKRTQFVKLIYEGGRNVVEEGF